MGHAIQSQAGGGGGVVRVGLVPAQPWPQCLHRPALPAQASSFSSKAHRLFFSHHHHESSSRLSALTLRSNGSCQPVPPPLVEQRLREVCLPGRILGQTDGRFCFCRRSRLRRDFVGQGGNKHPHIGPDRFLGSDLEPSRSGQVLSMAGRERH